MQTDQRGYGEKTIPKGSNFSKEKVKKNSKTRKAILKGHAKAVDRSGKQISCCDCGTKKTPQWRSGPKGPKSLCNACGVKFKKEMLQEHPYLDPQYSPQFVYKNQDSKIDDQILAQKALPQVSQNTQKTKIQASPERSVDGHVKDYCLNSEDHTSNDMEASLVQEDQPLNNKQSFYDRRTLSSSQYTTYSSFSERQAPSMKAQDDVIDRDNHVRSIQGNREQIYSYRPTQVFTRVPHNANSRYPQYTNQFDSTFNWTPPQLLYLPSRTMPVPQKHNYYQSVPTQAQSNPHVISDRGDIFITQPQFASKYRTGYAPVQRQNYYASQDADRAFQIYDPNILKQSKMEMHRQGHSQDTLVFSQF